MKFRLCRVLLIVLIIAPVSVSAETDNTKENNVPKPKRSVWQRVFPRTGDIEGTVLEHDTDTPLVEAEVHIVETKQHQKTDKDGTFQFTEIPVGTYTLSISHSTHSTPTTISIKIHAGETLRGRFYPGAAVPFINTTDSGDIDGYVYSQITGQPLAEAEVRCVEIDMSGKTDAYGTPPITRTFDLSTDGNLIEFAECLQGLFQRLWRLYLLTRVQCEKGVFHKKS